MATLPQTCFTVMVRFKTPIKKNKAWAVARFLVVCVSEKPCVLTASFFVQTTTTPTTAAAFFPPRPPPNNRPFCTRSRSNQKQTPTKKLRGCARKEGSTTSQDSRQPSMPVINPARSGVGKGSKGQVFYGSALGRGPTNLAWGRGSHAVACDGWPKVSPLGSRYCAGLDGQRSRLIAEAQTVAGRDFAGVRDLRLGAWRDLA